MSKKSRVHYKNNYEVKGFIRYMHLTKRFRERLKESEPSGTEIYDMLEQTKDPERFLRWTKKYNVGVYRVNFRNRDIIIISNKKSIFTTYGEYKYATKEEHTELPES